MQARRDDHAGDARSDDGDAHGNSYAGCHPLDACRRVRLAWLSLLLSFPAFYDASMSLTPAGSDQSIYPRVLAVFLAGCALLVALIIVVFVWMGRGYRWARIVYSAAIL